jgi:hypothetical protein
MSVTTYECGRNIVCVSINLIRRPAIGGTPTGNQKGT